jgi:predicted metal-binding membrane protein
VGVDDDGHDASERRAMVLAHLSVARRRGDGALPTIVFIGGYLLAWSAIGVVPLVLYWGFSGLDDTVGRFSWLHMLAGMILIVAGVYQFTGWKQVCLEHCQSPLKFVMTHDFRRGVRGAVQAGIVHGAFCFGCCWALMTVLMVVGLMNLVWMTALFALFFVEKHWKHGLALAKVAGSVLVVLGAGVMLWPPLLELISR